MSKKGNEKLNKDNAKQAKTKLFKNPLKPLETTIISATSKLEGSIETEGTIVVCGSVKGTVCCGSLEILRDGIVNAKVEAANISVAGDFEGEMICNGKLTVLSTGKVVGDISYGTLSIESGGLLDGTISTFKTKEMAILPLFNEG